MTSTTSIPRGTPANNTPPEYIPSWEQTRDALPAWLRLRADRLDRRAMMAQNVREMMRLLSLADKARNLADWYQAQGGAK